MERRTFLKNISAAAGGSAFAGMLPSLHYPDNWEYNDTTSLYTDEGYWAEVRLAYSTSPNIINLNNGGVSPQPRVVQETFEHYNRLSNEAPSYYMWRILDQGREALRTSLAELGGCLADEIAINRNTTEALDTVILGLPLQKGDEVVLTQQDYPNMRNAWNWRQQRDGIRLAYVHLDLPSQDEAAMVKAFTEKFTPQTKVVHITHMVHYNGQILPVRKIADEARMRGIEVVCDGAHSFAHKPYRIPDLGCDYFGTSLHKWRCAPFGTGMLYVRKERISGLAPLFPGEAPLSGDIRKYEALGTRSFPAEMATGRAIDFHLGIGPERKAKRLHYLKNYWVDKAMNIKGFRVHTPHDEQWSGALSLFSLEGKTPAETEAYLFRHKGIHTVGIEWDYFSGVRVTPNVYTSLKDLDRLVDGIQQLSRE